MHILVAILVAVGVAQAHPVGDSLEPGTILNRETLLIPVADFTIPVSVNGNTNEEEHNHLTLGNGINDPSLTLRRLHHPIPIFYRQPTGPFRPRRSTQPTNLPAPGQGQPPSNSGVDVDVQRSRAGTHLSVDAQRNVYTSPDGRTSVDAHGRYDRVYNGPGATRPNYNAGVRFSHKW